MELLTLFVILTFFVISISIANEKLFHMPNDIALVLLSLLFGVGILLCRAVNPQFEIPAYLTQVDLQDFLLEGVLCFMLFSGASNMHLNKFVNNIKTIALLALLTTFLSSFLYGTLFFLCANLFHFPMDFWTCVLLGCIISPTDPIAATSILNKLGLSKSVTSVIEGESLFNDGTGVVLFVFVRGLVTNTGGESFAVLICKEVLGAVVVGLVISFFTFRLVKLTKDPKKEILISLMNVALVYIICEHMGFSGVLASVVCGMYYSFYMEKIKRQRMVYDSKDLYTDFWDIIDTVLNCFLFVLIGLSVLKIQFSEYFLWLVPLAIGIALVARSVGVLISALLIGIRRLPSRYSLGEFVTLMTWSALRGGLSLALVLGTATFLEKETYSILSNVTFVTIFFTIIVQGLTTGRIYRLIEAAKQKRMLSEKQRFHKN